MRIPAAWVFCLLMLTLLWRSPGLSRNDGGDRRRDEFPTRFDPARDAAQDIRNAVKVATETHKRILLDVGGEWCIWCRRLDTLFAEHPDIDRYLHENYVVVKVNWSPENRNSAVLSKYPKIPGYPHFFVLESSGELLRSQDTGALEAGKHHDPEKVMAFLKRWAPNPVKKGESRKNTSRP